MMTKMIESLKRSLKRIVRVYVEMMNIYGEALLKGGSYGC